MKAINETIQTLIVVKKRLEELPNEIRDREIEDLIDKSLQSLKTYNRKKMLSPEFFLDINSLIRFVKALMDFYDYFH